jgi:threonine/homoserine/homoserine lactone efflux protein
MSFALAALTFGVVAGLKPGPLGVFVIHQTMSKGKVQGFVSSLAPILTDGPIILLALLLTLQFNEIDWFISLISIFGSIYLVNIGYKIFKEPNNLNPSGSGGVQSSLATAMKINFLSPAPYIFWLTIGTSYILMGTEFDAAVFIVCALLSLCFTKFLVAAAIATLGSKFNPRVYSVILRSLSVPLLVFSVQLMYSGVSIWL